MNKLGESKLATYVLIAFAGFTVLYLLGYIGPAEPAAPAPVQNVPGTTSCADTSVTMDTDFTKWGTPATAVAGTTRYFRNGITSTITTGNTATVTPGETIVMVVEMNNGAVGDSNYAKKAITFTVPCGSFQAASVGTPFTVAGYKHSGKVQEMIQNLTSLTLNAVDTSTYGINSATCAGSSSTANVTIGSGGNANVEIQIKGSAYEGLAPYGKNVVVVEGPKTNYSFDKFTLSHNGVNLATTTVPQRFSTGMTGGVGQAIAFLAPGCPDVDAGQINCDLKLLLHVEAKSTANPESQTGAGLNYTIYPQDFDRDTVKAGIEGIIFGVEDNVGTASSSPIASNICVA